MGRVDGTRSLVPDVSFTPFCNSMLFLLRVIYFERWVSTMDARK